MLVFIDESGDPGFKVTKGSSAAFAVAMVAFADRQVAIDAQAAIKAAATAHRVFPEFKFSKSRPEVRDLFFETVAPFKFCLRGQPKIMLSDFSRL